MVPATGVEPAHPKILAPEASASTNSATRANLKLLNRLDIGNIDKTP